MQDAASNPLGLDFGGNWLTGAALIAVLAPVYIFYGFESAGDISEETKDAGRQVPRAMRHALIWGGVASFILIAALLLAMPENDPVKATVEGGGVPFILSELASWVQDFLLVIIIFAFFSCGTSIQGAGSRLAFSYSRDGALPASGWISRVHPRFKTPVNALLMGAVVTVLFALLVFYAPSEDKHLWFITYPANINGLVALVSFGVSGIYLSFFLTVIAAIVARARGWIPEGSFQLGKWGWPVYIVAAGYLGLMLVNVVAPTGLTQPPRLLQPRLDHPPRDLRDRGRRRGLLRRRSARPEGRAAPPRRARADRRRAARVTHAGRGVLRAPLSPASPDPWSSPRAPALRCAHRFTHCRAVEYSGRARGSRRLCRAEPHGRGRLDRAPALGCARGRPRPARARSPPAAGALAGRDRRQDTSRSAAASISSSESRTRRAASPSGTNESLLDTRASLPA